MLNGELKIGVIGVGNLGSSLAQLLSRNGYTMTLVDPDPSKLVRFETNYDLRNYQIFDVAFVCVKPAQTQEVLSNLNSKIIVSTVASVDLSKLKLWNNSKNIVRCMPNLPISTGSGSIVWYGKSSQVIKNQLNNILRGPASVWVNQEDRIDLATALLGSGPAYFSCIYNHLAEIGQDIPDIDILLKGMIEGSLKLDQTNLIKEVATKGGVTESILESLETNGLKNIMRDGINSGLNKINTLKKNQ